MRSSTGRWVCGNDFWGRTSELRQLEEKILDHNHVLLTGQRRMGKTSIAQELGRRLKNEGWVFLFVDVEAADSAEDVIAEIAKAAHSVLSPSSRFIAWLRSWAGGEIEVGKGDVYLKVRAKLHAGNWRRRGQKLIQACVKHDSPVLLVIDELPIFLKRILREDDGEERVEEFLSWLRSVIQTDESEFPVLIVSGSIGLEPLVQRHGISDRINYFYPFRLGPWNRADSVACFERLTKNYRLQIEDGVAVAVYETLGIGIPHHVQTFFVRLRDFAAMRKIDRITVGHVEEVYQTELLGPPGQIDLVHYENRLNEALDEMTHTIAMELLAEAAIQDIVTLEARNCLQQLYAAVTCDASARIADAIDILVHDGYLESSNDGYKFSSNLLKDWWSARFHGHHDPLVNRCRVMNREGESDE